jgi:hypothetical protein
VLEVGTPPDGRDGPDMNDGPQPDTSCMSATVHVTLDRPGMFINSIPYIRMTGAQAELRHVVYYGEK